MFIVATAVALGCLQQFRCNAQLPSVGKCSFMEYYCTLREYESHFFKALYNEPSANCGLQVWIMYYRFLNKSDSCFNNAGRRPQMANIKGVQSLYCSGLDLGIPLVSSLSPCSNAYKYKVDRCISDFAAAFIDINETQESLCRKRGEAKMCTVLAWQNFCNQSDVADAIFNKVIGNFNPYCKNDKDPWAVESDLCSSYRMPYRNPECGSCSGKPKTCPPKKKKKSAAGIKHGVLLNLLNILFYMTAILYLDNLMLRM